MTTRHREETLPSSKECGLYYQGVSLAFGNPSEVEQWNQNVVPGDWFPLTPPDSASDCTFSDPSDMANSTWSPTSQPGEIKLENSQDYRNPEHHSNFLSQAQVAPVTSTDFPDMGAATWLNTSQGPVDLGLSPSLSYESQSSHTLNSFSEPEIFLPPSDLESSSFSDNSWSNTGHVVYRIPQVGQHHIQGTAQQVYSQDGLTFNYRSAPVDGCSNSRAALFLPEGVPHSYQRRPAAHPPPPVRRLLPRTPGLDEPTQTGGAPTGTYESQAQGYTGSQYVDRRVSTVSSGSNGGPPMIAPNQNVATSVVAPQSHFRTQAILDRQGDAGDPGLALHSETRPFTAPGYDQDQQIEDFSSLVCLDAEDQEQSRGYQTGLTGISSGPMGNHTGAIEIVDPPVLPAPAMRADSTRGSISLPNDHEEGRARTHHLYFKGPDSDGWYRCPFKQNIPSCNHEETKLKCNYDKFIDSHIKPFRCRYGTCSTLRFSSTACLLRHEREAHGMHGHGTKPFVCLFAECERSKPEHGFPRAFNQRDHMKRVHSWVAPKKESIAPTLAPRQKRGRKRKAPDPDTANHEQEQVYQQRQQQQPQQQAMALMLPSSAQATPLVTQNTFRQPHAYAPVMVEATETLPQDHQLQYQLMTYQWGDQRGQPPGGQMSYMQSGPSDGFTAPAPKVERHD